MYVCVYTPRTHKQKSKPRHCGIRGVLGYIQHPTIAMYSKSTTTTTTTTTQPPHHHHRYLNHTPHYDIQTPTTRSGSPPAVSSTDPQISLSDARGDRPTDRPTDRSTDRPITTGEPPPPCEDVALVRRRRRRCGARVIHPTGDGARERHFRTPHTDRRTMSSQTMMHVSSRQSTRCVTRYARRVKHRARERCDLNARRDRWRIVREPTSSDRIARRAWSRRVDRAVLCAGEYETDEMCVMRCVGEQCVV